MRTLRLRPRLLGGMHHYLPLKALYQPMTRFFSGRSADFRSDTVTVPDAKMTLAMMDARCGDDVYGEDPTVNQLEELAADMCGKEAALFVPSGTMGNLVSMAAHVQHRGGEVILGDESHIFRYEQGGASALLGLPFFTLPTAKDGTLSPQAIQDAIREDDSHLPRTALVCLENTHNRCGGAPIPASYMEEVADVCGKANLPGGAPLPLHVDGARIFNAAAALDTDVATLLERADSASVCLSKGLGAPVGSVVVGSKDFIARARRARKMVGGGMRQAGVIAGCGIVALRDNSKALGDDHRRAKSLARGLAAIDGIKVDVKAVRSNIVFFDIEEGHPVHADALVQALEEKGVRIGAYGGMKCRAVTHGQVKDEHLERFLEAAEEVMSGGK